MARFRMTSRPIQISPLRLRTVSKQVNLGLQGPQYAQPCFNALDNRWSRVEIYNLILIKFTMITHHIVQSLTELWKAFRPDSVAILTFLCINYPNFNCTIWHSFHSSTCEKRVEKWINKDYVTFKENSFISISLPWSDESVWMGNLINPSIINLTWFS